MQIYKHRQVGTLVRFAVGIPLLLLLGFLVSTYSSPEGIIVGVVVFVLALCLYLFHSLTAEVTNEELHVFFGPGLIRKRWRIEDIQGASHVRNRWYYGWGVRITPVGWMFNVSGFDAVELQLANGKKFRVGTDDPRGLIRALEKVRA